MRPLSPGVTDRLDPIFTRSRMIGSKEAIVLAWPLMPGGRFRRRWSLTMQMHKRIVRSLLRGGMRKKLICQILSSAGQTGAIPGWLYQRLPVEIDFPVRVPNGSSFQYFSSYKDAIGRHLFWGGLDSYEPETMRIFYKLAERSDLVLDIGAYTGLFTLVAATANRNLQVIAFEPVPRIYQRLQEHIQANRLEGRCEARQEAVSDMKGSAQLHVPYFELPVSASLQTSGFMGVDGGNN